MSVDPSTVKDVDMFYHNPTRFIDCIEFYVDAPQELVVKAFMESLLPFGLFPDLSPYHVDPSVTNLSFRVEHDYAQYINGKYYRKLVYIRKLRPNRNMPSNRTKVSIYGQKNVDDILKYLDYCLLNLNRLSHEKRVGRKRNPENYPKVNTELCRMDLTMDICMKRISYELLLAIVNDRWKEDEYYKINHTTGFIGDSKDGRTLYLGNTRRSKVSVRLYEKGKYLTMLTGRYYPSNYIRLEMVFRYMKGERPPITPSRKLFIEHIRNISSMGNHPLVNQVLHMINKYPSTARHVEDLKVQHAESIYRFGYDINAYERFAKMRKKDNQDMVNKDMYCLDDFHDLDDSELEDGEELDKEERIRQVESLEPIALMCSIYHT